VYLPAKGSAGSLPVSGDIDRIVQQLANDLTPEERDLQRIEVFS
jgi:hypothetical protein